MFSKWSKDPISFKNYPFIKKKMWWISWYLDRLMKESNEEVFETVQIISIWWIMSLICMNLKEIFHYCCLMKPRKGWSFEILKAVQLRSFKFFIKRCPMISGSTLTNSTIFSPKNRLNHRGVKLTSTNAGTAHHP